MALSKFVVAIGLAGSILSSTPVSACIGTLLVLLQKAPSKIQNFPIAYLSPENILKIHLPGAGAKLFDGRWQVPTKDGEDFYDLTGVTKIAVSKTFNDGSYEFRATDDWRAPLPDLRFFPSGTAFIVVANTKMGTIAWTPSIEDLKSGAKEYILKNGIWLPVSNLLPSETSAIKRGGAGHASLMRSLYIEHGRVQDGNLKEIERHLIEDSKKPDAGVLTRGDGAVGGIAATFHIKEDGRTIEMVNSISRSVNGESRSYSSSDANQRNFYNATEPQKLSAEGEQYLLEMIIRTQKLIEQGKVKSTPVYVKCR